MTALRIHTHCQVAQKSRHTNQNLSKSMAALTHGQTAVDKARKHNKVYKTFGERANFKFSTFNKNNNV